MRLRQSLRTSVWVLHPKKQRSREIGIRRALGSTAFATACRVP
jgi:hypothetical protein